MNTLYSRLTYASQPFPFNQLKRMTATSGFDRGHTLSVFHHLTTVLQAIQSSLVIGCSYDIYFAIAAVFLLTTAIPTAINYLSPYAAYFLSTCVIRNALLLLSGSPTLSHCYWCTSMSFTINTTSLSSLLALLHCPPPSSCYTRSGR